MPCYHPLKGYRAKTKNDSGKYSVVFNPKYGYLDQPQTLPCGQCIGCRLERSRQWAIRCVHEASQYENNSFLTLTYDNDNLPYNGSLDKTHFQKFIKRLRKSLNHKIRYFHCGEYGEKLSRPHYHAILFNLDFDDKELFSINDGNKLYTSKKLTDLWGKGHCTIGEVNFETCAYTARYITKKITGRNSEEHYTRLDDYGEFHQRIPEYTTMSRRPGIGQGWLDSFLDDVYPSDFITLNGKKLRPPKYYDKFFEENYPEKFQKIKALRKQNLSIHSENNTPERLEVREKLHLSRASQLKRSYEHD